MTNSAFGVIKENWRIKITEVLNKLKEESDKEFCKKEIEKIFGIKLTDRYFDIVWKERKERSEKI